MRKVQEMIGQALTTSQTQTGSQQVKQEDKQIVNMVYARLKTVFGNKYNIAFPTEKDERLSKREWQRDIISFSLEELERGFRALKSSDIEWPDIKSFLSLCKTTVKDPSHKLFALPKPCNINREEGKKRSAELMKMMKGEET